MTCELVLPEALPSEEAVLARHHVHLQPTPRHVAEARRFITEHAPLLSADERDVLLLLTSELVTNAVIHARTPLEVGLTVTERHVLVTVHDLDLARPEQQPYAEREGGWGLGLVRTLSEASAMTRHAEGGKTAWFRLLRGRPSEGPGAA